MSFEDDLRRIEEHVAEARRFVQSQKGLIPLRKVIRLCSCGARDAIRIATGVGVMRCRQPGAAFDISAIMLFLLALTNWARKCRILDSSMVSML
jgi:hypothetical protein